MRYKNDYLSVTLCVLVICVISGRAAAKSLYAITKHTDSIVQIYDIDGDRIKLQRTCDDYPDEEQGAVGLAVDPDSRTLFSSYDKIDFDESGRNIIETVDALTIKPINIVMPPEEVAGVVFDSKSQRLLAVQRDGPAPELFIYRFNSSTRSLQLDETKNLFPPIQTAYGICLDEKEDKLYITDNTNFVHYFDVQYYPTDDPNFTYAGNIEVEVDGDDYKAVAIAVYNDGDETKYLYTGGYSHTPGDHSFLIRTDPNNPDRPGGRVGVNLGGDNRVVGLATDDTGMLYITTLNESCSAQDSIQVYDPLNWPEEPYKISAVQTINDWGKYISGPADLVVGPQYVPPFAVSKVDDVNDCASPRGQEITYNISFDYQWDNVGYPDPNIIDSIEVVDYLPREVDFDWAQPDTGLYEYDDPNHSYTWTLTDSNSFGDTQYFELAVQAQNERLTPGGVIENNVKLTAAINEGVHIDRFTLETPVCDCTGHTEVIYVDETVTVQEPNGTSWQTAFDKLQDALVVALPCDEIWVADGTYAPTEGVDPNLTFQLVNGVGVFGGFEGTEEERSDRNWADPCKETILSGDIAGDEDSFYVVTSDADVKVACLDGFTIKRGSIAGVATDEGKGLDLGISSCYNKIILLSEKMLGSEDILENERSES